MEILRYYPGKIEQCDFGSAVELPLSIAFPSSGKARIGDGLDGMAKTLAIRAMP
jgi:hypothetical protein